ncbi:MAG: hypothetical protein IPG10_05595 [Flavobacteriales bacterium]|nr:hypothetical protein [Flavobacteriales bacterium]MBK6754897.1 hypothetical protein [Flavobacteriales bacterium]MBK7084006.1 hypothetical protein [Flavobacteriales bacterium]MBK7270299.1 hypothetical protein [Flavobacteriales bacterium]MBK7753152.1 hypothetical protein [Flavobacteriales bacterium]
MNASTSLFDLVLERFERHKFGVIGTLVLHTMIMFGLAITQIQRPAQEETPKELQVDVMEPQEAERLVQALETGQPLESPQQVTNAISDLNARIQEMRPQLSSGAQERMEQDLKALEQSEFDRLAQERKDAGQEVTVPALDPTKWDKRNYLKETPPPTKVEGTATVSFQLKDRRLEDLDIPAYLCTGQGQVTILISVDRSGAVRKATVDKANTRVSEECMSEYALLRAQEARFDRSATAPEVQEGTITFVFVRQ